MAKFTQEFIYLKNSTLPKFGNGQMSRLIRIEISSNFSYLLGFCSKIDSQMHWHLR